MPLPPSHFVAVNESENGRWYLQHILQTPVIISTVIAKEEGPGPEVPSVLLLTPHQ
jgi:hypothetical protein